MSITTSNEPESTNPAPIRNGPNEAALVRLRRKSRARVKRIEQRLATMPEGPERQPLLAELRSLRTRLAAIRDEFRQAAS